MSTNRQITQDAAHVVVIGAGFAGQSVVDTLAKGPANVRVTVIDHNLYSTFQPLLYQVATGGLNPGDVSYAIGGFAGHRRARYIQGELADIDVAHKRITLADGRELGYDYLVLATGVTASFFGIPGAEQNAFALYTRRDSVVLRDHIMAGFERLSASANASVNGSAGQGHGAGDGDGDEQFAVTVVGGGATGVEMAGTLAELRSAVLKATFPDVDPSRVHIRLVEMAPQLLMPFHPRLRRYTFDQLVKRGVHIRLDTRIRGVEPGKVLLDDGQTLRSDLTVWAAGVAAPQSVRHWGLPQGKNGRLTVGADLRVTGQDAIFAVGDIGINPGDPSPQLASPAMQQGRHVGAQIKRLIAGEDTRPFRYHDKGIMATIGRRSAVVQLAGGLRMTGTIAWLAWLGLHLVYLLGFRNRVSTLINLSWRYIAWGHGGGVIVGDGPAEPVPSREPVPRAGAQASVVTRVHEEQV